MVKRTCEDILKFGTLEGGRPTSQGNPLLSFFTMLIYVQLCGSDVCVCVCVGRCVGGCA